MGKMTANPKVLSATGIGVDKLKLDALRKRPVQVRGMQRVTDVLDGCERLLRTKRIEDISIEDIASEAKIQIGSLYHFFPDKTAVIVTMLERVLAEEGETFKLTPDDDALNFREYLAALEERMTNVWRSHSSSLDLYFAFRTHPLIWEMTLESRRLTAEQIAIKLIQIYPMLTRQRALQQGSTISMTMGVLIDNLEYLPPDSHESLRCEVFTMLSQYVGYTR